MFLVSLFADVTEKRLAWADLKVPRQIIRSIVLTLSEAFLGVRCGSVVDIPFWWKRPPLEILKDRQTHANTQQIQADIH
jgi:type III secretory pathway component EscT